MHYQIHLNNIELPMLAEADTMEHVGNMLVLYKANTAVAAISLAELKCVIEVESSSVPPKDVSLSCQTAHKSLQVEQKALSIKNNILREERRKAMDKVEELEGELFNATAWLGWLSLAFAVSTIVAIALTLKLVFWS